ncbi:MAG: SpoIIE family protein phosphatase [Coriobacteriales bacterium]|nr:SpoIIE family protein phosphatase [Coriobacteriales bacterium]
MSSLALFQFAFATLLPVVVTVVMHLLQHRTVFGQQPFFVQQIVIGLAFGGVAIFGTEFGIPALDATMNVRDAAPLAAGLVFGWPAGVLAGVIGGVERWFAALWGKGMFTRLACSVATVLVGFYAAALRKLLFDNKRPTALVAFGVGVVGEVLHLLLIFLTNTSHTERAFSVVRVCSAPMILCNGLAVMLCVLVVSLLQREPLRSAPQERPLAHSIQAWMCVVMAAGFVVTTLFTFSVQSRLMVEQTTALLRLNVEDARKAIVGATNDVEQQIVVIVQDRHVGESGGLVVADSEGTIKSTYDTMNGKSLDDTGLSDVLSITKPNTLFVASLAGVPAYGMYLVAEGYHIIALLPVSEAQFSRNVAMLVTTFMEVLVFAALFAAVYSLIKILVVHKIMRVNGTLGQIMDGDLDAQVDVRSNKEFALLSQDINLAVEALKNAIADAEARFDADLEYARTIQRSALPMVFPPYPNRKEFQIFALMDPANEVGGDFYDFYLLDEEHLAFLVADVSGKGIPAAMFMMRAKTVLKNLAESGLPVEEVLARGNDQICEGNEAEMFVTCWMGVIDLATGCVAFGNAGHNPPVIIRGDGTCELCKVRPNMVLGGIQGIPYRRHELDMQPGDVLFLYTDGVTEATNEQEELFGEKRLLEVLGACADNDVEDICKLVHASVDEYVGAALQFDDITALALRFVGGK